MKSKIMKKVNDDNNLNQKWVVMKDKYSLYSQMFNIYDFYINFDHSSY
jgi:hypothetical protein